ncbi:hypothetical protein [Streptacidiphilus melanogenes]|uniref:hypothetical protein n=1 Tax=Streptacidiphilus melanogenes TaxID=411235 RepID=UPI0005A9E87D|nr:hypothetical protein [Streptacidiphilus melanogenes]
MPDALPAPDDLVQLQRELDAADNALADFAQSKTAEYRARFPEPRQALQRARWTEEDIEEFGRLRQTVQDLRTAVRQHPTTVRAHAVGCARETAQARKVAARRRVERSAD